MTFSRQKREILAKEKPQTLNTFLIALCMSVLVFLPYIIMDKGYFLFYGDFNVQQIPFYEHCHRLIKDGVTAWDFGTDLGANFIGSYTFYLLGSPFFLITLLFPTGAVAYLIGPLLMLKFACCALTAYLYLRRFLRNAATARLGAILYAFSGFSVYNIFFNHFHEAMIVFPVLLLSIELLITENKRGAFALSVFLAAAVNYFFFFGMVVFSIIYWAVRMLSHRWKFKWGRFFALAGEAVIGVLLASILLVPTIYALAGNSRLSEIQTGWGALLYGKESIYANILQCFFFPPDLPARPVFFPEADVKWSSLGGWLPVFSMVGVWAFMSSKRHHWLTRLIKIMIFMALVPILNSSFYMFNSAYYARWYYMPILMMCLATCMAVERKDVRWTRGWNFVFGITAAVTLVIGFFPAGISDDGKITRFGLYTEDSNNVFRERFFIWCAISLISLLMLRSLMLKLRSNKRFFVKMTTVCVCIISVIYTSVFVGLGKTHSYEVDKVMIPALLEGDVNLEGDKDTFRIDAYECVDNTGMYLGYNTINAFHSIVPTSVTEFYEFIGEERGVASRPTTDSAALRSLLSVRYLLDLQDGYNFSEDGADKMVGYKYVDTQSKYDIYENENYIPYGFTYDYFITEEECLYYGEDNAANMMLKAIVLDNDQIKKYGTLLKALSSEYYLGGDNTDKEDLDVGDTEFPKDAKERAAKAAHSFRQNKDGFTAKINLEKENLVFFSIPYDKGFKAYVNGKEMPIEKVNVGFMAVKAYAGENEITFVYKTPGLALGITLSLAALIALLCYLLIVKKYYKNHKAVNYYPEGEKLLELWEKYDNEKNDTFLLFSMFQKKEPKENLQENLDNEQEKE